jgi:HlyD family secretion protein
VPIARPHAKDAALMAGKRRWWLAVTLVIAVLLVGGGSLYVLRHDGPQAIGELWRSLVGGEALPDGFAHSNGRIEATVVDVASKLAGRLSEVGPREGDRVAADSVVARLDTESLQAQLRQARAELNRARQESEHARAVVSQRDSELEFARRELQRLQRLSNRDQYVAEESVDQARTAVRTAEAALLAARTQVAATEAAIEAAQASIERVEVDIDDSVLRAPRSGRVLYRLAEPGEIVGVGGKVLTLLDLADVYMVIYLPATVAGRVPLHGEARIVLDAAPEYVIPAEVSFVAARAQFTPKQVETRSAREKLSFRVKLQVPRDLLSRYEPLVKTGVPGVAYVRLDPDVDWPEHLVPKLPPWKASEATTPSN